MKYFTTALLALALTALPSTHAVQARGFATLPASACHILNDRDFAAAGLPQPRLLAGITDNVRGCEFVYGGPPHVIVVTAREYATLRGSDPLQPNVCSEAMAQAHAGQHCTPLHGYGKYGALLQGIGPGGEGAAIIFRGSRYQVSVNGMGVPGGSLHAVQRLGKILAARYR